MEKRELLELFDEMISILGERVMLDELFHALSSDELKDNLTYIADNHDLGYLYED